jgi:putative spermidine/putrescine transport system ATP-binding protein
VIEQLSEPLLIYDAPATTYVADFIGATNLLRRRAENGRVELGRGITLPTGFEGGASVLLRPENLLLGTRSAPGLAVAWEGTVSFVRALGATVEYEVDAGADGVLRVLDLREPHEQPLAIGEQVAVGIRKLDACVVLPADTAP